MKRQVNGATAGAVAGLVSVAGASAQSRLLDLQGKFLGGGAGAGDVVSAGNGGVATSSASGGAVGIADINSGGNAGSAIGIGDTSGGSVFADGGDVANLTDLGITANGGTAISDASGGDYNLAFVS